MVSRRGSRGLWEFCILCIWNLLAGRSSKRALQNLAFLPGPGLNQPRCKRTMHKAVLHFWSWEWKECRRWILEKSVFLGHFFLIGLIFLFECHFFMWKMRYICCCCDSVWHVFLFFLVQSSVAASFPDKLFDPKQLTPCVSSIQGHVVSCLLLWSHCRSLRISQDTPMEMGGWESNFMQNSCRIFGSCGTSWNIQEGKIKEPVIWIILV